MFVAPSAVDVAAASSYCLFWRAEANGTLALGAVSHPAFRKVVGFAAISVRVHVSAQDQIHKISLKEDGFLVRGGISDRCDLSVNFVGHRVSGLKNDCLLQVI